jgi:predicted nucleotidyltransferase
MGINELIEDKKNDILDIAAKYGASNVRIFGSVALGTANENSDIDFLVDMEAGRSLFDMGGLLMELKKLLNREIDIVTENGLHWYIKDNILKEAKSL